MKVDLPSSWHAVLAEELSAPYFQSLSTFVDEQRAKEKIYPPEEDVFNAFQLTPFDRVKAVLLGQDPYHGKGQAHGLCFSVRPGVKPPPSLVNVFKELHADLGCRIPNNGFLQPWAEQGLLMLNAVLTVQAHKPNSHKSKGWEKFTDAVIRVLNNRHDPVVFLLWGAYAQKKGKHIDENKHVVIKTAHPSPFSEMKFFGSRPFSAANAALEKLGKQPMNWQIPDLS